MAATTHPSRVSSRLIDLTGKRFGKWTVLALGPRKHGQRLWLCQCDCGREQMIYSGNLKRDRSHACKFCVRSTHGQTKTPEYIAWRAMRSRCSNKRAACYKNYGGRGITVCSEWSSFAQFLADMGLRTSPTHTLERIDNSIGYSPENCCWATRAEQLRNTRRNRIVTFNGRSQCVSDWAKEIGISPRGLLNRLDRGWSIERAMNTPSTR